MNFPTTVYNRVAADFDSNYPRQVRTQEEFDLLGPGWFESPLEAAAWTPPKLNGPSFEEWVRAGYSPAAYPPHGYQALETEGFISYRADVAARIASEAEARDAGQKAKDEEEVATAEKVAVLNVLQAKINAAQKAGDTATVDQLERERASL